MTGEEVLQITRLIAIRDPRRSPATGDQILIENTGRTLIVSYTRKLAGMEEESVFYRARYGVGPIGPMRSITLEGWTKLTAGSAVSHHAGVKAA